MSFINNLKKYVSSLFNNYNSKTDKIPNKTSELSIIDTKDININRDLTEDEKSILNEYEAEFNFDDIASSFNYDKDVSNKLNIYRNIFMKKINISIDENKKLQEEISSFKNDSIELDSNKVILKRKLDIGFNYSEILKLINNIKTVRRDCELKIIALENLGNNRIREIHASYENFSIFTKSKWHIPYSKEKVQIQSLNEAIERLKIMIKIADTLTFSMQKELMENMNLEKPLEIFIKNGNTEENLKLINELLLKKFKILEKKLNTIQTLKNEEIILNDVPLGKLDFSNLKASEKNKIIVSALEEIDFYTMQNYNKFLEPEIGILSIFETKLNDLKPEIETDYLDLDLYAKKNSKTYKNKFKKYRQDLIEIQKVSELFEDYLSQDFETELYKIKFYINALIYETNENDLNPEINIYEFESENEQRYFTKFVEEIINNIILHSDNKNIIKFVKNNLNINDANNIVSDYIRLISLLRIEKYDFYGLATLKIYNHHEYKNRYFSIEELEKVEKDALEKFLKSIALDNYCQEIILFYKNKINQFDSHWIDLKYTRISSKALSYIYLFTSHSLDSFDFYTDTQKIVNKKIRDKNSNWNENHLNLQLPLSWKEKHSYEYEENNTIDIDTSHIISRLCIFLENINAFGNSKFNKEKIRDKILNLHSFKIDKKCKDGTNAFIDEDNNLQVNVSIKYNPNETINDFIYRASLILLDSLLYSSKPNLDKDDTFTLDSNVYSLGKKDVSDRGYIFHGFDIYYSKLNNSECIDLYTRSLEEYIFSKKYKKVSNRDSKSFGLNYSVPISSPFEPNYSVSNSNETQIIKSYFINKFFNKDSSTISIQNISLLWKSILNKKIYTTSKETKQINGYCYAFLIPYLKVKSNEEKILIMRTLGEYFEKNLKELSINTEFDSVK